MPPASPPVRTATDDDRVGVVRVLEGALLDVDVATVERRIAADAVLVAADDGPVRGALLARPEGDSAHVEAVAVASTHRRRGVGTALVATAADRWGRLTAAFDADVRPFYEATGFEVVARAGDGRLRGVRTG